MSIAVHVPLVHRPSFLAVVLALVVGGAGLVGGAGCDDTMVVTSNLPVSKGIASPALAILASDYASSSVSLYNPSTGKLFDACVTSATSLPQKLSGNVLLPTQAQVGGELVLVDSEAAVLTFVQPSSCAARGQLSVSTGGFKSYPHDVVTLSATKAYVTRYGTNLSATADPSDFDDGDDLLIVDPTRLTVTGRIALATYAVPGSAGQPTHARPDRAILAGGMVYVSLNSIDENFGVVGTGRVAVIDPDLDTVVATIDLPEQKDCSGLSFVASTNHLYVACGGGFNGPAAVQVAESALVEVDLTTMAATRKLQASTLGTGGLNFFYGAVAGDAAFVATLGAYANMMTGTAGTSDVFYFAPLGGGPPVALAEGSAGDLGTAVVDPASNKVFLPDGNFTKPMVRAFDATSGAALPAVNFEPNPSTHLPPRAAAWY
jgi:hypothetical protein